MLELIKNGAYVNDRNNVSISNSNSRISLDADIESCLTVEYILNLNMNDVFQLYMRGDNTNIRLLFLNGNPSTTPVVPDIPSIILNIVLISE